jgi:hypothetical protein
LEIRGENSVFLSPSRIWSLKGNSFLSLLNTLKNKEPNTILQVNWGGILDLHQFKGKLCLAGGCLVSLILGAKISDYDLFFVGTSGLEEMITIIQTFIETCGTDLEGIYCTPRSWTVIYAGIKFQFIFRDYKCKEEILLGFDIDPCCIVFDGTTFMISDRAKWSFENHAIVIDSTRMSPTYEIRLWKYWKRGFDIIIPSISSEKIHLFGDTSVFTKFPDNLSLITNNTSGETKIRIKLVSKRSKRNRNDKAPQIHSQMKDILMESLLLLLFLQKTPLSFIKLIL